MGPLREFRRRLRSRRNQRRLDAERERYLSRFASLGLSVPGEEELRSAILSRFPGRLPRRKGALSILAVYHSYNWEKESLHPALRRFGDVFHYDWFEKSGSGNGRTDTTVRARMNADLLTTATTRAADRPFDMVFTYLSGEQVAPETVEALRGLGAPIVNLSLNDKEGFVGRVRDGVATGVRDICRHFDLCWTSTLDSVEKYRVEGAAPLYLPEGANPGVHRPYEVEKTLDVSFVGQRYGNRPAVVRALREAGIRVEAFGPGWPSGPLSTPEMVLTYSRSRVNLGFGGVAGHEDTYCLKGRDFEVPMSGGLYLTEEHEELSRFYEVGKELVAYRGIEDLIAKIRWLLANPGEAEAIRAAGRARALREHTWEMRFSKVLGILGII
jgi:hypothetical protein